MRSEAEPRSAAAQHVIGYHGQSFNLSTQSIYTQFALEARVGFDADGSALRGWPLECANILEFLCPPTDQRWVGASSLPVLES